MYSIFISFISSEPGNSKSTKIIKFIYIENTKIIMCTSIREIKLLIQEIRKITPKESLNKKLIY